MLLIEGIIFLGFGAMGSWFVGRRRFNRRNFAGVEEFRSYAGMLLITLLEKCVSILCWFLVLYGISMLMVSLVTRCWG